MSIKIFIRAFFITLLLIGDVELGNSEPTIRNVRQMRGLRGPSPDYDQTEYPLCRSNNIVGACLENAVCAAESGRFIGYCGYASGVCCEVVKSCGSTSSSHAVRFQSPSFPDADSKAQICTFKLHIGRGICALRIDIDVLEMKKYSKDYCPTDSFNIIGTKKLVAPLCGNMTGWTTTFEMKEYSTLEVAAVTQGDPPFKFSTLLTQIPCKDVVSLQSPPNAGLINTDAEEYEPSTTTKSPPTTKAMTTSTVEDLTEMTTRVEVTTMESTTSKKEDEGNQNPSSTPVIPNKREANDIVTPLPVGEIKTRATRESVIARNLKSDEEEDFQDASKFFDPTPNSVFKKIYDLKAGERCQTFDGLDEASVFSKPYPHSVQRNDIERCWFYDRNTGTYKVNEDCESNSHSYEDLFRIIGGKLTRKNEYPWQVALIYKKKFFCGGALISDRHILTASHCLFGSFYGGIHNLQVSLGDHDLKTKNETENLLMGVKRVIWNLHYSSDTTENDIGILELKEPVEFNYRIMPVNLPTDLSNSYSGQNVTVTGWGRNSLRTKSTSSVLKKYTAPIDDIEKCVKRWKPYPSISAIKGMHICLNVTYGTPCHGDSGGPLVACNDGPRCTLIGVVSFGFPLCRNVGLPAVFTRVTSFKKWIDINTSPLFYYDI